jgi:hypothetical protein
MLNASWATLLRQIPEDRHNTLMVRTTNGTEISLQNLLRIDYEFVIFKGRLSGSQDAGRLFILPYSNIDYCGINRFIKDEEYNVIFATLAIPDPDALPIPQAAKPALSDSALQAPAAKPGRSGMPVKSSILDRFRTRNATPVVGGGIEDAGE